MYASIISEILPEVHAQVRDGEHLKYVAPESSCEWRRQWSSVLDEYPDLSRSFACEGLSLALFHALDAASIPARREFHVHPYSNQWHFVIRHSLDEPTPDDIITDLNPWSFASEENILPDFLHARRGDAIQAVIDAGSTIEHAATLRAQCLKVSTIAMAHTLEHSLVSHFMRVEGEKIIKARLATGYDFGFPDWRTQGSM